MPLTKVQLGMTETLVSGTAVTASGTSVNFTGLPAGVKRITVMFSGVSTGGTNSLQIQLGTGATPTYTTSGYLGQTAYISGTSVQNSIISTGFTIVNVIGLSTYAFSGIVTLCLLSGNTWTESSTLGINSGAAAIFFSGGTIALGAALTAVRVIGSATGSPSDTFDAGTINIMYE